MKILKKKYRDYKMPIVTRIVEEEKTPYHVLISTMISLRTKDDVTEEVSRALFAEADTPEEMIKINTEQIEKLIYPAGFYRNKAKAILKTSRILLDKYGGKVPDSEENLLELPGVGRKTANLVLALSFNRDAICVDTHVHRISNRLGLVDTKNPEQTEYALMDVLPRKWWRIYNDMLVTWGQNICTPVSPFCSKCDIEEYCPKKGVERSR